MRYSFKSKTTKFNNKPQLYRGWKIDSKLELARFLFLEDLKKKGVVDIILRQTPFHLPGGIKYLADFVVFWSNGAVSVEDVKGVKTETYKLKKKLVEEHFKPIKIIEIGKNEINLENIK